MHTFLLALLLAARPFTPEELLQTHRPDDLQVSPDGKWASVTVRQKSLEENRDLKDIWLLPLTGAADGATADGRSPKGGAGAAARQFTRNGKSEHARWSPDGKELLVVRDGQLWIYTLAGGDARQLTTLSTGANGPTAAGSPSPARSIPTARTTLATSSVPTSTARPPGAASSITSSSATGRSGRKASARTSSCSRLPATGGARRAQQWWRAT